MPKNYFADPIVAEIQDRGGFVHWTAAYEESSTTKGLVEAHDAALAAAVAAAGAFDASAYPNPDPALDVRTSTAVGLSPRIFDVSATLTIGSPDVPLFVAPGTMLRPASGVTVTIAGDLVVDPGCQWIDPDSGGHVTFPGKRVRPEWWGAGDIMDVGDSSGAMQAAMDAVAHNPGDSSLPATDLWGSRGVVELSAATYVMQKVNLRSNVGIEGAGRRQTYIVPREKEVDQYIFQTEPPPVVEGQQAMTPQERLCKDIRFRGFTIARETDMSLFGNMSQPRGATGGLDLADAAGVDLKEVEFNGLGGSAISGGILWDLLAVDCWSIACGTAYTRPALNLRQGATDQNNSIMFIGCRFERNPFVMFVEDTAHLRFVSCKFENDITGSFGDPPTEAIYRFNTTGIPGVARRVYFSACQFNTNTGGLDVPLFSITGRAARVEFVGGSVAAGGNQEPSPLVETAGGGSVEFIGFDGDSAKTLAIGSNIGIRGGRFDGGFLPLLEGGSNCVVDGVRVVGATPRSTGDLTEGSHTIGNVSSRASNWQGKPIYGTGIPAGATVVGFTSDTLTLSAPATATIAGARLFAKEYIVTLTGKNNVVAALNADVGTAEVPDPLGLLHVSGGQNVIRDCTATLLGGAGTDAVAIHLSSASQDSLVDSCQVPATTLIRDDQLNNTNVIVRRKGRRENAAPTSGYWNTGEYVEKRSPSVLDDVVLRGWLCTASGSPGTWVPQYVPVQPPA